MGIRVSLPEHPLLRFCDAIRYMSRLFSLQAGGKRNSCSYRIFMTPSCQICVKTSPVIRGMQPNGNSCACGRQIESLLAISLLWSHGSSFVRSFICSFVLSIDRSFVRSLVHSLAHSFVRSFISFARSRVGVWDGLMEWVNQRMHIRSFTHSLVRSFIRECINPFIHTSIHSFTHSIIHSLIW